MDRRGVVYIVKETTEFYIGLGALFILNIVIWLSITKII